MADWLAAYRLIMLDELLRRDGLGDSATPGLCVSCMKIAGEYRCNDCFGGYAHCLDCIVSSHRYLPLHRLQVCPDELLMSNRATDILILGLGGRLFQARNSRESRSGRQSRTLRRLLSLACGNPTDPCCRPFRPSYRPPLFLQVFQKRVPRKLSTTSARWLVPGVGAPSQNGFHVRPPGHVPQDITSGKAKPLRLLQRDHAKDG